MKTIKIFTLLASLLLLSYCGSDDSAGPEVIVPESFTIDLPGSLSSDTDGPTGRADNDGDGYIEGNEIYESLRGFIHIGETSAEIMEFVLQVGAGMETAGVRSFTFTGDEDGREKRIDITDNVSRGGVTYDYEMTMVDVENEDQALQLLYNVNPVEGVGILNPFQLERDNSLETDAYIRIDYSEDVEGYEAIMQVQISGLAAVENGDIDNMAMWVGKNGDIVDIVGNSNHPNFILFDDTFTGGRNYAFVGRGDATSDLGVVRLALPPSNTTTDDVLDTYSVFNVLQSEINTFGITNQFIIDQILVEAQSPAYFNSNGFITSGTDNRPSSFSDTFTDLTGLRPFIPNDVRQISVRFID